MNDKDEIMDEAIGWALRLRTADAEAWRAFTAWLERSPANLAAYERVAEADDQLEVAIGRASESESPRATRQRRTGLWVGGAMAAAAAAALVVLVPPDRQPDFYAIETVAGVHQSISLPDGSEIAVNGDSRVTLDRNDRRFARLESGEALFTVASDADAPFRVEARGTEIRNIGTVFGVRADPGEVAVEVAEGAVRFDAAGQSTRLSAGERATYNGRTMVRGSTDVAGVGGWRDGQLSFMSATFADVARDIERASGIAVSADPSIARRRFSGNIMIDEDRTTFRRRLGALLDVDVRLVGDRWVLAPSGR